MNCLTVFGCFLCETVCPACLFNRPAGCFHNKVTEKQSQAVKKKNKSEPDESGKWTTLAHCHHPLFLSSFYSVSIFFLCSSGHREDETGMRLKGLANWPWRAGSVCWGRKGRKEEGREEQTAGSAYSDRPIWIYWVFFTLFFFSLYCKFEVISGDFIKDFWGQSNRMLCQWDDITAASTVN